MTKAEACLWKYALRAGLRKGYTFNRQRPVLKFIADFMCKPLSLVIEVDGITHTWPETIAKDKIKDEQLTSAGFYMLRFTDDEVLTNMEYVIEQINLKIAEIERIYEQEGRGAPAPRKPRQRRGAPPPTPSVPEGDST